MRLFAEYSNFDSDVLKFSQSYFLMNSYMDEIFTWLFILLAREKIAGEIKWELVSYVSADAIWLMCTPRNLDDVCLTAQCWKNISWYPISLKSNQCHYIIAEPGLDFLLFMNVCSLNESPCFWTSAGERTSPRSSNESYIRAIANDAGKMVLYFSRIYLTSPAMVRS